MFGVSPVAGSLSGTGFEGEIGMALKEGGDEIATAAGRGDHERV